VSSEGWTVVPLGTTAPVSQSQSHQEKKRYTKSAPHWRMCQQWIARKIKNKRCYAFIAAGSNKQTEKRWCYNISRAQRRILLRRSGLAHGTMPQCIYPYARPEVCSRIRHRNLTTNKLYNVSICQCINSNVPAVSHLQTPVAIVMSSSILDWMLWTECRETMWRHEFTLA
jgi:hypothetical protein